MESIYHWIFGVQNNPFRHAAGFLLCSIETFSHYLGRVFVHSPRGQGSVPSRVIPKTLKNGT